MFNIHKIFYQVFKQGLTLREGSFGAPEINLELEYKLLIVKEKLLLLGTTR